MAFRPLIPRGISGAALALCVGALVYYHLPTEPATTLLYGFSALGAVLLLLTWIRRRDLSVCIIIAGLLAGASYAQYRTHHLAEDLSRFPQSNVPVRVQGVVQDVEYTGSGKWRVVLETAKIDQQRINGLIRVHTREHIPQGARVQLSARLYPPGAAVIPQGFDFQRYAFFQRIVAVGYAVSPVDIASMPEKGKSFWAGLRKNLYLALLQDFSPDTASVLRALILGDRQSLSDAQSEQFRRSGLAHLLAISGLHIGMITFVVFGAIRRFAALHPPLVLQYPVHHYAAGIAVLFAYFYIELTGGAVSMYRAFIMICFVMLAWIVERDALRFHSLALAAIVLFLARPSVVMEPGFLLSFSAVVVLIGYWQQREWWMQHFSAFPRLLRLCIEFFITSSLIALCTSALLWGHFQTLYPYGALANIVAVPVMGTIVMPLILLYILSYFVGLTALVAVPLEIGIKLLVAWAEMIAGWAGSYLALPPITPLLMFVLSALSLALMVGRIGAFLRGMMLGMIAGVIAGFVFLRTDTDFVVHRPSGNWAIVTEQGFMLPENLEASRYLLDQWQKILHRPRIPWQDRGRVAGLEWSCSAKYCLLKKNNQELIVALEDCAEKQLHPLRYCATDPYRNSPAVRIMLETSGIKSLSLQRNRPWNSVESQ